MLSYEMLENEVRGQVALQRIIAEASRDPDAAAELQDVLRRMWGRPTAARAGREAEVELFEMELGELTDECGAPPPSLEHISDVELDELVQFSDAVSECEMGAALARPVDLPPKRSQRRPKREAVRRVLDTLYPGGRPPDQATLPNTLLCRAVGGKRPQTGVPRDNSSLFLG